MTRTLLAAFFIACIAETQAASIPFDLVGTAGAGLLPGNEPAGVAGGTGGEIGTGITYDSAIRQLSLTNVGWGSSQGFTDLSSAANNSHVHGPTAANNGNGFTQTAVVLFNLSRSTNAVTGGVFTNALFTLTAAQETDLFNDKYYINIHTANNGGGEMRGFLVPVGHALLSLATNGSGTIGPGGGVYTNGAIVALTATPNFSRAFTGWSGSATGTINPLSVTMTSNKAITAGFVFVTSSVPSSIGLATQGAQIAWMAVTNLNFQPQYADALGGGTWSDLGAQIPGNNATNLYNDPLGTNQIRFYRVLTRP